MPLKVADLMYNELPNTDFVSLREFSFHEHVTMHAWG